LGEDFIFGGRELPGIKSIPNKNIQEGTFCQKKRNFLKHRKKPIDFFQKESNPIDKDSLPKTGQHFSKKNQI